MSRRAIALVVLGAVTLALGVFLLGREAEMTDTGGPGIVPYELAFTYERASEIRADWGESGIDAARSSLRVDYAYLVAYGAFFVVAAMATRDLARRRGWERLAPLGPPAVMAAAAAPAFDAIENTFLLIALDGHGGDAAPLIAGIAAIAKFATLACAVAYVLAGLVARLRDRRRAE
jgi:hypothetical protein